MQNISGHTMKILPWHFGTGAFLLLIAAGCGSSGGEVSGRVFLGKTPLSTGSVTFVSENGKGVASGIDKDGSYKVSGVPPGPVKILVALPFAAGMPKVPAGVKFGPPKDKKLPEGVDAFKPGRDPGVTIPDRYKAAETTDLTYTVASGSQTHDIELKEK